ncbi:MAG: alcohol dehydrogenase [Planctomycetaceae bacterium]|nr:alcohol dehydrogenase [Planctomycetaceae bacterium]
MTFNSLPITLLALALMSRTSGADDWPQWRGPQRDGSSAETTWTHDWPNDGPPSLWKVSVGIGFSSVVVADNRLYTVGNENNRDTVYCLDTTTGREHWTHTYDSPLDDRFFEGGPTATPTIDGERIYLLGRQGDTFCLDAVTGAIQWSKNVAKEMEIRVPGWGFAGSPVVHGDSLLLGVGEAGVLLNKDTGEVVWASANADAGYATPRLLQCGSRWCAIVASSKYVQLVDLDNGTEQWRVRWLTRFGCNAADPIVDGDKVFISSGYNRGSALLRLTAGEPEIVWKSKEFQNQFSSSVLMDGHLFGIDGNDTGERALKCVELASGEVRWAHGGFGSGALMAADSRLIILSEQGELVIAKASHTRYEELARAKVLDGKCWTVPVLANGLVYCRDADGDLTCSDLRR